MNIQQLITIIVPVYNAIDQTNLCIQTLLEHTDLNARIIIINDASSDVRISVLLDKVEEKHSHRVQVIHHLQNVGFVKTVNEGLYLAQGSDCVILNSDTCVPADWLNKFRVARQHKNNIASLTPWSNAATICSLFKYCEETSMPENISISDVQKILNEISPRFYPQIPTGVGFCMFMSKESIQTVGILDEQGFPIGYGEENDWCQRASSYGYTHHLVDDLFVYHQSSASFGVNIKKKQTQEATQVMQHRWPTYCEQVDKFIANYQLYPFIALFKQKLNSLNPKSHKKNKSKVLMVLHSSMEGKNNGGTEYHVKELSQLKLLQDLYEISFFWREAHAYRHAYYSNHELVFTEWSTSSDYCEEGGRDDVELLTKIFDVIMPDLVHIHHFMFLGVYFVDFVLQRFKCIATIHDFFWLCPTHTLLNSHTNKFCELPEDEATCIQCLINTGYKISIFPFDRRKKNLKSLSNFKKIIAPTQKTAEIFLKAYPSLQEKINILPHFNRTEKNIFTTLKNLDNELKILILGHQLYNKGANLLFQIAHQLPRIKFLVLGGFSPEEVNCPSNINFLGTYQRKHVYEKILSLNSDLALFLSIGPETFSYTLSEVMNCALPVLAPNIGAFTERINGFGIGWLYLTGDIEDITSKIIYLDQNRNLIKQATQAYSSFKVSLSEKEYSERLISIYNTAISF